MKFMLLLRTIQKSLTIPTDLFFSITDCCNIAILKYFNSDRLFPVLSVGLVLNLYCGTVNTMQAYSMIFTS